MPTIDVGMIDVSPASCANKTVYLASEHYPGLLVDDRKMPQPGNKRMLQALMQKMNIYDDGRVGCSITLDNLARLGFALGCSTEHTLTANEVDEIVEGGFKKIPTRVYAESPPLLDMHLLPKYPKLPSFSPGKLRDHFLQRHVYNPIKEATSTADAPIQQAMEAAKATMPEMDESQQEKLQAALLTFRSQFLGPRYCNEHPLVESDATLNLRRDSVTKGRYAEVGFRYRCEQMNIPHDVQDTMLTGVLASFPALLKPIGESARRNGGPVFTGDIPLDLYTSNDASAYYNPDGDTSLTGNKTWQTRNNGVSSRKGTYSRR